MPDFRITQHPILEIPERKPLTFYWQGETLRALAGETIASALFANGIRIFGHHPRDASPLGIFCANGQCSQCMVIANQKPVKSCMELVEEGMQVLPAEGLPHLPEVRENAIAHPISELEIPVLIIGGGPAGLSAAIELGRRNIPALLVDDKHRLGGKLVLQTHRFFGSARAVYAGTRGIDIATRLEAELATFPSVTTWLHSTALGVFSDKKVGVLKDGQEYVLVTPQVLLVASGAREKFLAFKGNTLPGVYGAGAFQTLVNRDLVRPAERLFIIGGGNVGLIAGYHALQAGIQVVGLAEALPKCGGYKVHADKLVRMGVPIYTSHTILSANGKEGVESVTIAAVDEHFAPLPGSEKSFACDSVLIAVGLDPVDEFYKKAREYKIPAYVAGDAQEIAEASAAIFSGKIQGVEIMRKLGHEERDVPPEWRLTGEILRSKPGETSLEVLPEAVEGIFPVLHCTQEIPCDPCTALCDEGLIRIEGDDIRKTPHYAGTSQDCKACGKCVTGCPGLAITLVNFRLDREHPIVSIPYEFDRGSIRPKDTVILRSTRGEDLGEAQVLSVSVIKDNDRTSIVRVKVPVEIATRVAGLRIQAESVSQPLEQPIGHLEDDTLVCRCERVTAGEIRGLIRSGCRDINEIKAISRAGMGACGSKTCGNLIYRVFQEEGIPRDEIAENTHRPLFVEVPLGVFAGLKEEWE